MDGSECLDDNTLLDLCEGRMDEAARAVALGHADGCEACHALLVESARAGGAGATPSRLAASMGAGETIDQDAGGPPAEAAVLLAGTRVGRYVVLGLVGAGGMGVVYAAYDPELDRKVALKLLRAGARGSRGAEALGMRLLREAQAMARLHHPHIVTVHDAGTFAGRVFLAMEFVAGETLAEWLRRERRARREIALVLLKAGRGLAAAHAAGVVHRDFKPDNVLVGEDGRVLVSDFGLARSIAGQGEPDGEGRPGVAGSESKRATSRVGPLPLLGPTLTVPGALAGTPAYMAPEQIEGKPADVKSDIYAFGVTAYEALVGSRPFRADTIDGLYAAIRAGRIEPEPRGRMLPSYLRRALTRALSADPAHRPASLEPLLTILARDPRRRMLTLGAGLGVAGLVAATAIAWLQPREAPPQCQGASARMGGIWDDSRRQGVRSSFEALRLPYGDDAFTRTRAALDAYERAWVRQHREACEATRVHGQQSESLLDLRMACLERRRGDLGALVDVLSSADAKTVENSVRAASNLEPLTACADLAALRALGESAPPPAAVPKVAVIEAMISRARALRGAGKEKESLEVAKSAVGEGRGGHRPTLARALVEAGNASYELEKYADAESALHEAFLHAHATRADRTAATSLLELAVVVGEGKRELPAGQRWVALAEAAMERVGAPAEMRVRLHGTRALLAMARQEFAGARQELETALRLVKASTGEGSPGYARILANVAKLRAEEGNYDEAVKIYERVVALDERALGPDHPQVARDLVSLGVSSYFRYDFATAAKHLERSLKIREKQGGDEAGRWRDLDTLGGVLLYQGDYKRSREYLDRALAGVIQLLGEKDHRVAMPLHNLGDLEQRLARYDEAEAFFKRARALTAGKLGARHPSYSIHVMGEALVGLGRGDLPAARARALEALGIREKALGAAHPEVATSVNLLGLIALRAGELDAAGRHFERARAIREKALGAKHPDLAESFIGLAEVALARGDASEALALAERAGAIQKERGGEIGAIADRCFVHARALAALGKEPARVRELLREARSGYARVPHNARELAMTKALLAKISSTR